MLKSSEFMRRAKLRLSQHSILEHFRGLLFARKMTRHGIILVTGKRPKPRIINNGGDIIVENCQFYEGVRLEVGKGAVLRIGNGTYLNRNTLVVAESRVEIGKDCKIAWDVVIMDSDLHPIQGEVMENKPVIIEDEVWIGCRCIILKGVRVGEGAVIAAGSVVTRNVPPHAIVGGVPARILGNRAANSAGV